MLARPLNHLGFLALIASSPHRLYIGLLRRAHFPSVQVYSVQVHTEPRKGHLHTNEPRVLARVSVYLSCAPTVHS